VERRIQRSLFDMQGIRDSVEMFGDSESMHGAAGEPGKD
jgi:hypothetical protein